MPRMKRIVPTPLPDRPGWWKLLLRRQRRLLRPTAFLSLAFVGIVVVLIGINAIGRGATLADRFGRATAGIGLAVHDIVIIGREKTPEPLLRAALGAMPGEPILSFSVNDARRRIESIAWVRSAIVERVLPGTIRVVLNERRPFAVWQNQGKFVLIDHAGNVVTDSDIGAFVDKLPLVVGGAGAPLAAATLLDAMAPYPDLTGRLVAAVRVGERRWDLCMTSGANVLLPEGAEIQALAKLQELETGKQILDRPLQEIDLRLPDRLRIRPMTETPCGQTPDNPARAAASLPRKAT